MPGLDELLSRLEGVTAVLTTKHAEPEGLADSLLAFGTLVGKEEAAREYLAWHSDVMRSISDRTSSIPEERKPRIFYKVGYGSPDHIITMTDDFPLFRHINRITGCINLAGDIPSQGGWAFSVDNEWLVSQPIEVLVLNDPVPGGFGPYVTDASTVAAHYTAVTELPVFAETPAVRNGRVHFLGPDMLGTPQFVIGFAYMATWFHPELFADFDPEALHQEYLSRFLRVDVDLSQQGVFVYSEGEKR